MEKWESPHWAFDAGVEPFKNYIATDAGTSALMAWDPVKQELLWERANPGAWNSGTLTTACNLVFQGQADGLPGGNPLLDQPMIIGLSSLAVTLC